MSDIDQAAAKLGVRRAQVYRLIKRFRDRPFITTLIASNTGPPMGRPRAPRTNEAANQPVQVSEAVWVGETDLKHVIEHLETLSIALRNHIPKCDRKRIVEMAAGLSDILSRLERAKTARLE